MYGILLTFVSIQLFDVYQNRVSANRIPSMLASIKPSTPEDISCHKIKCFGKCERVLPAHNHFRPSKNTIYFIETSCRGGLQSRAACSVESAAYANPKWNVVVLFAGPFKPEFWTSKTFTKLLSIPNLHFYRVYPSELAKGTPIEDIFSKNILVNDPYPVSHSSDLLKLLILYKNGGLYLDSDMIVMKSFDSLPKNFIALEQRDAVASGIMAVTKNGIGHEFTEISMRNLADSNDHQSWLAYSNNMYTKSLQDICKTNKTSEMNETTCRGFHVLDHSWFYPVDWTNWIMYYKPGIELTTDPEVYTHHVWNSYGWQVGLQPTSYLTRLAVKYCPLVYDLYKDKFGQ